MNQPRRPAVRYHGGKWKLAPWIIGRFPPHRVYVEPYGGGASVLLRKPRAYAEIYNDLDGEIVNLFKVLRDQGEELIRQVSLTPFARDEFELSYMETDDHLERARRTVIRSFQGFGSAAASGKKTGFRFNSNRSGTTPAHDWANYPKALGALIERLSGVVIENTLAVDVLRAVDSLDALHYVDPPYVGSTRDGGSDYRYEMTDEDHRALADCLKSLKGMVILSGYDCDLYRELYGGWHKVERQAFADGARARVECLWLNESAAKHQQGQLFAGEAA